MTKTSKSNSDIAKEIADEIAGPCDTDILLINAPIERGLDDELITLLRGRVKRKNVLLLLVTSGGNADAAFRIARSLQDNYEKVTAFVSGYCKSAGTLCVVGAHEIVIGDIGELGPLDVQVYKKDELGELSSGLVAVETLSVLQGKAFEMFEEYFLTIKERSYGTITFKMATEIAIKISVGLLEPLYRQIDPMQVGEIARLMKIAKDYGRRLDIRSKNCKPRTLEILTQTYPSHGFVIDRNEVEGLFVNVRAPSNEELGLLDALGDAALFPGQKTEIKFISSEVKRVRDDEKTTMPEISERIDTPKQRANPRGNAKIA